MRSTGRGLLALAVIGLTFCLVHPAAADHCDVADNLNCAHSVADHQQKSIVTSGLKDFLDRAESGSTGKSQVSEGCADCEWSLVPSCLASEAGSVEIGCLGATLGCSTPGDIRYALYLRRAGGPWELQGTICRGPGAPPAAAADVGRAVRAEVIKYLPDAKPSFQPPGGAIVNLPTIFNAGEPATMRTEAFDVLGFQVVVKATARWEWQFDQGVVKKFAVPGGTYPDASVSYTYADRGPRRVWVTTFWRATFTLNGEGPFPVPGPEISKTSPTLNLPVREAHAELIATR